MSREIKINKMPEEKKYSLFSEGMNKLVATIITGLIVVVIGQGLLLWKNQDALITSIVGIKEDISIIKDLNERVIVLEQSKQGTYGRLSVLEQESHTIAIDRNQRGGSFRRDDADKMKTGLEGKIHSLATRENIMEIKLTNLETRMLECRNNVRKIIDELENDIEDLEDAHDEAYKSLEEKCDILLENGGE